MSARYLAAVLSCVKTELEASNVFVTPAIGLIVAIVSHALP